MICPDRDVPGLKHGELIAKDFPNAQWLYPDPISFQWGRALPKEKGFDIGDWIDDGATKAQILEAIQPRCVTTEETPKNSPHGCVCGRLRGGNRATGGGYEN